MSVSVYWPSEADSRPGAPILPFSFLPNSRPMDDLMLFFLLALWRESWLAVVTPSAERLERKRWHEGGKRTQAKASYHKMRIKLKFCFSAQPFPVVVHSKTDTKFPPFVCGLLESIVFLHLRNSRWSSSPAPGWVCVILSSRSARGTGGGVESIRASALHSSPSLLFC